MHIYERGVCDHPQALKELEKCDVIEHLLDFTDAVAADPVILEQAMVAIPEEREHHSAREVSKRDITHPNPSLYVILHP